MDLYVLIKRVPDPNLPAQFVTIGPERDEVVLHAATQFSINLYDLNAVECAIALKDACGGRVTVLTADNASADQCLRRAIAMGADNAVRVELDASGRRDCFVTARALTAAIRHRGTPGLIIAGRQSSDTDAGYVPYLVAAALDMPALSPIVEVRSIDGETAVVGKLSDSSVDTYEVSLPALLLVSNEINKPRTPSMKGVIAGKKAQIEVISATDQGIRSLPATYALKAGARTSPTAVYSECSVDEKAAALLAALEA